MESSFGKTHSPLTVGVNGSDGLDFNSCSDGSVGVKDLRKWRKNDKEIARKGEKNLDLAKNSLESMRFRHIRL